MSLPKGEFVEVTRKLQESLILGQKVKDELLVYLIERALYRAEKITAVNFPNSKVEQLDPPAFMSYSYRAVIGWLLLPAAPKVAEDLIAEITYLKWTADNLLRHTVYVGPREDKPAHQVRRER